MTRFVLWGLAVACSTPPPDPWVARAVAVPTSQFGLLRPISLWFGNACRPWGPPAGLYDPLIVHLDQERVSWGDQACTLADGDCERAVAAGLWARRADHDLSAWNLRGCHSEPPLSDLHIWLIASPDASAEVAADFARETSPYTWWLQVDAPQVVDNLVGPCPAPAPTPTGSIESWARNLAEQLVTAPAVPEPATVTMVELRVEDRPRRYDCDEPK